VLRFEEKGLVRKVARVFWKYLKSTIRSEQDHYIAENGTMDEIGEKIM